MNVADLWTLDSSFMPQCFFLVSASALFDPLITEKCECFSLDLAAMLLLLWRIQMLSLLDLLLALCSNSVAWSRLARAALVQTDKRSFNHTITSSFVPLALRLPFDVGKCCGCAGVSYIMSALATCNTPTFEITKFWSAGKMVQRTEPFYEYVYRYTPTFWRHFDSE